MPDIRTQVGFSTPAEAASGAFKVINTLQDLPPARQVLALASAFYLVTGALRIDPRYCLQVVEAIDRDCAYRNEDTFNAVRSYARGEIKGNFP